MKKETEKKIKRRMPYTSLSEEVNWIMFQCRRLTEHIKNQCAYSRKRFTKNTPVMSVRLPYGCLDEIDNSLKKIAKRDRVAAEWYEKWNNEGVRLTTVSDVYLLMHVCALWMVFDENAESKFGTKK